MKTSSGVIALTAILCHVLFDVCPQGTRASRSLDSLLFALLSIFITSVSVMQTCFWEDQFFERRRHVFFHGPHVWNNLPQDIRLPSKANSRYFSSQNISAKQHCPSPLSVCTVYVCVCVCVCIFCVVTLESLSTLFVSCCFFFFFFMYISITDNISISMYIMCVQRFEPQGRRFTNFQYYYY